MKLSYDPGKRARAIFGRGLDFEDAVLVFAGPHYTVPDDRSDYGEERLVTYGLMDRRLVAVVWTPRGETRHIISMRKCNAREQAKFEGRLG